MASANLGTAYIKIAPNMAGVQGKVLSGFKGLGAQASAQMGDELGKNTSKFSAGMALLWGAATAVATKAIDKMMASLDAGIKRFDTMNNFPRVMQNLGIAASDSEKVIRLLASRLQGLPTSLDSAALGVQRLTSKNGDINKSAQLFLAMNNAILAGGAGMDIQQSALEQLTQAYAKGKPDMMEWRSMMTAMPAQLKQVAIAMGYIDADSLGEALRGGKVSMDDFMDTFMRLNTEGVAGFASFEDQARGATGGIQTGMANISTAWARMWAGILDAIGSDNINKFMQNTINRIDWLTGAITGAIKWVQQYSEQLKILGSVVGGLGAAFLAANIVNIIGNISLAVQGAQGTLFGFGTMLKTFGGGYAKVGSGLTGLSSGFKGLFAVVKAHPFIAIFTAIAGALALFFTQTETGKKAFEQIKKTVLDVLAKAFEALKPVIETVGNLFKQLATTLGTVFAKIGPAISNVLSKVGSVLGDLFAKIGPTLGKIAETIGGIFAKLGPVIASVFEKLGPVFEQIGQVLIDLFPALSPLMDAFGDLGSAIGNAFKTLGPAFVNLGKTFGELVKTIGPMVAELGKTIGDAFKQLAPVFGEIIKAVMKLAPVFAQLAKTVVKLVADLAPLVGMLVKLAVQVVSKLLPPLMDLIKKILPPILALLGAIIPVLANLIATILPPLVSILSAVLSAIVPIIEIIVNVLVAVINNILIPAITMLVNIITTVVNTIVPIVENALNFITSIIQFFVDLFSGNFSKLGEDIKNIWNSLWTYVKSVLQGAWNIIKGVIQGLWDFIKGIFGGLWNGVSGFLSSFATNVVNFFKGIPGKIWEAIKSIGDVGKNLVEGLWNGINNAKDWVLDKIKGFGNAILDGIKGFFGIASPSKLMAEMGGYIGEGLAVGLDDSTKLVTNAMDDMLNEATEGIKQIDTALSDGMNANLKTHAQINAADYEQAAKVQVNVDAEINEQMDLNKVASDLGYAVAMA